MMTLKIFFVYLIISGCCKADILDSLSESQDLESKAMACVWDNTHKNTLRSCQGILWRRSSVIVRASCLRYARDPYVQKGIANCTRSNMTMSYCEDEKCIRYVTAIYKHPQFPIVDLALLRLNVPYAADTRILNNTLEKKLDEWQNFITDYYTTDAEGNIQIRHYQMYTTPVKMICVTVILPTLSFALLFFYVIFYTGSSDRAIVKDIPYTNLTNEVEGETNI